MTLNIFDRKKESFSDRSKHIDYVLEKDDELKQQINERVRTGERIENSKLGDYLDGIANYLLESKDIESGRKIEDDFYRSEKDYHSNFAIGKNTIPVDNQTMSVLGNQSQQIGYSVNRGYLAKLFASEKLSEDDIRRFIVAGYDYSKIQNKEIRDAVRWLQDEVWLVASKGEKEIVKLFNGKRKVRDVAEIKGASPRYVRKTLQNIVKKTIKQFRFSK